MSDSEFKSKISQIYSIYENASETREINNQKVIEKIDEVYNEILKIDNIKLLNRLSSNLEEMYLELVLSLDSSYNFSNDKVRDEVENFLYRTIDTYHSLAKSSDINEIKKTISSIANRQKIHFKSLLNDASQQQKERNKKQQELEEVFLQEEKEQDNDVLFNPKEMKEFLDKRVIGQEEAKKDVISAIFMNSLADESISKNTCLLVGPTGSGKTLIAESVAEFLDLPFVNIDTTQLTMPGYVGANIEDFLGRLIESANGDIEKAESGIVMLDEIDKKGSESNGDVAGKGVLNTLLPFVQGTTYDVRYNNRRVSFDTSKLTIFMTGAFTDVAKGVSDKSSYTDSKIGFGTSQESQNKEDIAYKKLNIEDFVKHGDFPVELVGRISNIVQLSGHTMESLRTILTDSNISVLNLEIEKLKKIDVEVKYSDDYLDAVAEKALKLKTGARSLKATVENSIKEARWEVITSDEFKSIILNKDSVEDNLKAVLVYNDGNYTTVEDLRNKEVEKAVEKVKK
ncbi:MAG: AAA family ATPase [bacterium]|nr:AAA family ATPase [bacterium]